jgi:O-antigen ligase
MVVDNPLGIGLSVDNLLRARGPYSIPLSSTHNLYLAVLVQIGFAGFFFFMALTGTILYRNFRAWRTIADPSRRVLLLAVMLPLLGFFVVGVTESVWENGIKINQLFWLWCGISISTSTRMLAERRASPRSRSKSEEFEGSPAFGR